MRSDFDKVLVERGRSGSTARSLKTGWSTFNYDPEFHDDHPTKAPCSRNRQFGYDAKQPSDLIGPLKRFLNSRVGQDWNEIQSEIHAAVDRRSVVGRHFHRHVGFLVEEHAMLIGGKAFFKEHAYEVGGFYVHPHTNKLCYQERTARDRSVPDVGQDYELNFDGYRLFRTSGVWYRNEPKEVKEWLPTYTWDYQVTDDRRWRTVVKWIRVKQLNTKELREHGLRNLVRV